ncbi:fibronectin type III domain-containing protein [Aliarcobacter butzleri]|uniref:fibronectin type III domain-containing protein n=1 Tax=Aliarcobacter butzleri TaxID=28197 RepID=UPI0021B16110|nr:fibronectin type III domain-containing protein [Aliarcobacter butzleri]MCT7609579.1 fibronectin type III domain-containing protein [Aliarcobacter butzleri]
MIKLMKNILLIALVLLFSACSDVFDSISSPSTPKINNTVPTVNYSSIKSISDITSIGFEWQRVDDPRVVGYNFYRTDLQSGEKTLKLIRAIESRYTTHYVDKELEPKTKYAYQISSRLNDGSESVTTDAYVAETLPRIVPVNGAQAISNLPKKIKLLWQPHPDQRIQYYRVEKYNTTLNEWIHLATVNQRLSAEYLDTGLENNTTYQYRIKAFTFEDVESAPTKTLSAKTKPAPKSPTNVKASNNIPKKIFLTWSPSQNQDIIGYDVYRSSYSSFGFSKVTNVNSTTTEYTDSVDDDGRTYYYRIIAIDKDNLESADNITATKGMSLPKPIRPTITSAQIQGSVNLSWQAGDNRAVLYNVVKKIKQNFFQYKTVIFNNISGTSFSDSDIVSGVEYKYSVQAVDEFGLVSENSDEKTLSRK